MNIIRKSQQLRTIRYNLKKLFRHFGRMKILDVFDDSCERGNGSIQLVIVINLDRQQKRWEDISEETKRQKVRNGKTLHDYIRRMSAIDAKNIDKSYEFRNVTRTYSLADQYFVDPDPRLLSMMRNKSVDINMTLEERSVAESHVKVWQSIVEDKIQYALVLEDDVFFERSFADQINASWKELAERQKDGYKFDILYLSYKEVDRGAVKSRVSPNVTRLERGVWWMSGYILSYAGALKLLQSIPVVGPVDLWVNHLFNRLDVFCTPKSVIFQRDDMTSDNRYSILPLITQIGIQTDKTLLELEQLKGRSPVFCIGYELSDSQRLSRALSMLGYRCCNNQFGQFTKSLNFLIEHNRPLLFDAYIDREVLPGWIDHLLQLYPSAIVLFSDSLSTTKIIHLDNSIASGLTNNSKRAVHPYNISTQMSWKRLCSLLVCKVPRFRFPCKTSCSIQIEHRENDHSTRLLTQYEGVILEHDVHPWIVPYQRQEEFGIVQISEFAGAPRSCFIDIYHDCFDSFNDKIWSKVHETFSANLAEFHDENIEIKESLCNLWLRNTPGEKRAYSAASFLSRESLKYGRFETELRATKGVGIVTAFFLHRNNPWQEIDIELLGKDTTKVLLNVYYNPGDSGTVFNYGNRGTPIVFDLGFDASMDYHTYTIEWNPFEIAWYVDNSLIHRRTTWSPTPIPDLDLKLYCSVWAPSSTELAGTLDQSILPTKSQLRHISISKWTAEANLLQDQMAPVNSI